MSVSSTSQLLRSASYFPVADLEQSAIHYERVLGFHRDYIGGTPPEFAILSRDGLAIMLRLVPAPQQIRPNEKQGGTWDVFFWVRDARALHAELLANGADIVYAPMVQEAYQMEDFAVRDREGLCVGVRAGAGTAESPRDLKTGSTSPSRARQSDTRLLLVPGSGTQAGPAFSRMKSPMMRASMPQP